MKPYYQDKWATIYHGDCREILRGLSDASIDFILTDPPYGLSGQQADKAITVKGHAPFRRHFGEWDMAWNPKPLLNEASRLLRAGGALVAFCGSTGIAEYLDTPLQDKKLGVWVKTNPPPRVRPGYQNATEFWVWQVKAGAKPTWHGGFTQSNAIVSPNPRSTEGPLQHPTQKPLHLMWGFVERHSDPGELVADPYMGSGTTLVAAKTRGRKSIGIEREEKYCEIAAKRLSQGVLW